MRNAPAGGKSSKTQRRPNTKRTGELAEAALVVKASEMGFAVSKPWGDSEKYDFILDAKWRTFRVQVKCTATLIAGAYEVQSTYADRNRKGHYTKEDIDVLVAYIIPHDMWYVVPVSDLPASASLRFYPERNISREPRFEKYREAWDYFRKEKHDEEQEEAAVDGGAGEKEAAETKSPIEQMMTEWAQRVNSLYGRK